MMHYTLRVATVLVGALVLSGAAGEDSKTIQIKAIMQTCVSDHSPPSADFMGVGRARDDYAYFKGNVRTFIRFELPDFPDGMSMDEARLNVKVDFVSSTKYPPQRVVVALAESAIPGGAGWENQPDITASSQGTPKTVGATGTLSLDATAALKKATPGETITLCVYCTSVSGVRFFRWKASELPVLALDFALPLETSDRPLPDLLADWRKFQVGPVFNYGWGGAKDEATRQERFKDLLQMGITGICKVDKDPAKAGRLFIDNGLHGFMPEIQFYGAGEPTLDPLGNPQQYRAARQGHPWTKSIFSPVSRKSYYNRALGTLKNYGLENLFKCGDTVLMSSWDETGLYSRERMDYGYGAHDEFISFLRDVVFHDDLAAFNRNTGLDVKAWGDIPLPVFENRFETPGLWKYWSDFHAYYTYLFFRRGGIYAGDALENDVEFWTFTHASAKWPSGASGGGIDQYWASQLNRVLTVEDCQATYPGSSIHYSFTDQLSRRYNRPVLGWSWFRPDPDRSNDPLEIGRALARAMGHNTHGLIFWVYQRGKWEEKPEARAAVAHWHHVFQAHWEFLKIAERPKPEVAVVFPRNAGTMYGRWEYPKHDYGWTCAALSEAHVPYEIVSDNQVEFDPEILNDYRVLLIPSATWESPVFRDAVKAFIESGGYVYTDGDSFMLDSASGRSIDFLATFGIRPDKKYKGLFLPTYDSVEEQKWARELAAEWQRPVRSDEGLQPLAPDDADLKRLRERLPSVSGTALRQSLWDPRTPQWVVAETEEGVPQRHRTYHDIVTGNPLRDATVLARYGTEVCAVETDRTVWAGFRPGFDHACVFPLAVMRKWGEPYWPFEFNTAETARERASARAWITRIVEKAKVAPYVQASYDGKPAAHVETLIRQGPAGNALIMVINHESMDGAHELSGEILEHAEAVAALRAGTRLEKDGSGRVKLELRGYDVAILAVGREAFVKERLDAHATVPSL